MSFYFQDFLVLLQNTFYILTEETNRLSHSDTKKLDLYMRLTNNKNKKLETNASDTNTSLTLSNTKRGTDLGTLAVPFDQTFHPLQ